MKITGDVRPGNEFKVTSSATTKAPATFIAVLTDELRVTRKLSELFDLPDTTPVIAHWHGTHRTDGFTTTVAELKAKAV